MKGLLLDGNFLLKYFKSVQDIFGVLATQKFFERGKGSGIFSIFGFPLLSNKYKIIKWEENNSWFKAQANLSGFMFLWRFSFYQNVNVLTASPKQRSTQNWKLHEDVERTAKEKGRVPEIANNCSLIGKTLKHTWVPNLVCSFSSLPLAFELKRSNVFWSLWFIMWVWYLLHLIRVNL